MNKLLWPNGGVGNQIDIMTYIKASVAGMRHAASGNDNTLAGLQTPPLMAKLLK